MSNFYYFVILIDNTFILSTVNFRIVKFPNINNVDHNSKFFRRLINIKYFNVHFIISFHFFYSYKYFQTKIDDNPTAPFETTNIMKSHKAIFFILLKSNDSTLFNDIMH